jgi:hypothetical protein
VNRRTVIGTLLAPLVVPVMPRAQPHCDTADLKWQPIDPPRETHVGYFDYAQVVNQRTGKVVATFSETGAFSL